MTLNLQELAMINEAQAKLIHQLMIEKMELEHKLEQREYNRRFTNTKFKQEIKKFDNTKILALAAAKKWEEKITPPFDTAKLDPKKLKVKPFRSPFEIMADSKEKKKK